MDVLKFNDGYLVDEPGKWQGRVIGWRQGLYDQLLAQPTQAEVAEAFVVKERRRLARLLSGERRERREKWGHHS